MAAFWNRWAWLFIALVVFAGVIPAWLYGDQREHYNGLLVAVGWLFILVGGSLCKSRPSWQTLSVGFAVHKGKVLPSLITFALFYAFLGDVLIYVSPSTKYGYAWKYDVATANVVIEKQPYNCSWETAPLGAKHCHYEAQVLATKTATATDGTTALISYDGGKTWNENTAHVQPSVYVAWNKVED